MQGVEKVGGLSRREAVGSTVSVTRWRDTFELWAYGLVNARMILLLAPRVVGRSRHRVEVRVPLTYRSRNHFGSMQFGALMVGAELGPGILATKLAAELGLRVAFLFRRFDAELLHRASGDVYFVCEDGESVAHAIAESRNPDASWTIAPVQVDARSAGISVARFRADLAIRVV